MPIRHILVPTDFSPHSDQALEYATSIAKLFGADIRLLHCYYVTSHIPTPEQFLLTPSAWERIRTSCLDRLKSAAEKAQSSGVKATWDLLQQPAGSAIVEQAGLRGMELIVMGSHGHSRLNQALLGSVASQVIRLAPCPVLTVKQGASPRAGLRASA